MFRRLHGQAVPEERKSIVLDVLDLRQRYWAARPALSEITFNATWTDQIAILGPGGAGKSTLLNCLARLSSYESGKIEWFGRDISELTEAESEHLSNMIGLVQRHPGLVPGVSVLTNVARGAVADSIGWREWFEWLMPAALRHDALMLLDKTGVSSSARAPASRLSESQTRRVSIARTLMRNPPALLVDGVHEELDPRESDAVLQLLVDLTGASRIPLLYSTRDVSQALRFGNRVIGMSGGKIVFDKPTESVEHKQAEKLF
jgi:phosphonate transport system ATP-binding protein